MIKNKAGVAKDTSIPKDEFTRALLLITVPKEGQGHDQINWNKEKIGEEIGKMETFIDTIAGLKVKGSILKKRNDHFTLEIAAKDKKIFFYISCPQDFVEYVKQNITASFPEAEVEKVRRYNIFQPQGYNVATTLRLGRSFTLPLKTYEELDGDPLNNITNALSKLEANEGAAIQIVMRSAPKGWHKIGARVATEMQSGKTAKEALRGADKSLMGRSSKFAIDVVSHITKKTPKKDEIYEPPKQRQLSPIENNMVEGIEHKASKAGLEANIRIIVSTQSQNRSELTLNNIINSFSQFNLYQYGNKLEAHTVKKPKWLLEQFIFRKFSSKHSLLINTEECTSMFHFPLPITETPNIQWLKSKTAVAPTNLPTEGIVIGKNIYRGKEVDVRIGDEDRRRHVYIIGMTGVGKSVLLSELARQDIENGNGVCVIDPHGDLAEQLLEYIPSSRKDDVIYFSPGDTERPVGLNMLEADTIHEQDFAIQEMIQIFYKIVSDPSMIGPMFEHNMRNAMLTLMADKKDQGTIADIPRIFTDTAFQKYKLQFVSDPMVRSFWEQEMAKTSDFHKSEMLGYLISKVGRFIENQMMRNIIGQPKSGFDFKDAMNNKKILLVNLSKGKIGEVNSNLLGLIFVSKLQMAALSRADMPEQERKDYFLYIDEFQNYTTDSIATILSEARKYRLNLTMAHQYLGQLVEKQNTAIKDSVLGNVGTIVSFRIGVEDAETMARQFEPVFSEYDLINVDKYNAFMRTLVGNAATRPFSIKTNAPREGSSDRRKEIEEISRMKYGRNQQEVEEEIMRRSKLGQSSASLSPTQPPPPPSR